MQRQCGNNNILGRLCPLDQLEMPPHIQQGGQPASRRGSELRKLSLLKGWELPRKSISGKSKRWNGLRPPECSKMIDDNDKHFTIHSDSRVTLSPAARELCKLHGMTEEQMAQHLLNQHRLEQAGQIQKPGED